jgi:hypothetical protein
VSLRLRQASATRPLCQTPGQGCRAILSSQAIVIFNLVSVQSCARPVGHRAGGAGDTRFTGMCCRAMSMGCATCRQVGACADDCDRALHGIPTPSVQRSRTLATLRRNRSKLLPHGALSVAAFGATLAGRRATIARILTCWVAAGTSSAIRLKRGSGRDAPHVSVRLLLHCRSVRTNITL